MSLVFGTPDASAQLIKFGETEAVCSIDDDGVGVRNVYAAFNDGGTYAFVQMNW